MPEVGLIIIGDEILSGKIQDVNISFMSQQLYEIGASVPRVSILPDVVEEISQEVRTFSNKYDFVITSGGVGPTHDDVTMESVAAAFSVPLVVSPEMENLILQHQKKVAPEQKKMTLLPEGYEFVYNSSLKYPLIRCRNTFILPGIPRFLQSKFPIIIDYIGKSDKLHLQKAYFRLSENKIVPMLNQIVTRYPEVKFGSYPVLDLEYKVYITIESKDKDLSEKVCLELKEMVGRENVVDM